jgi:hypothetical protein
VACEGGMGMQSGHVRLLTWLGNILVLLHHCIVMMTVMTSFISAFYMTVISYYTIEMIIIAD